MHFDLKWVYGHNLRRKDSELTLEVPACPWHSITTECDTGKFFSLYYSSLFCLFAFYFMFLFLVCLFVCYKYRVASQGAPESGGTRTFKVKTGKVWQTGKGWPP